MSISLLFFPQHLKRTFYIVLVFWCQKVKLFFFSAYLGLKHMALPHIFQTTTFKFHSLNTWNIIRIIQHMWQVIQMQNCVHNPLKPFSKSVRRHSNHPIFNNGKKKYRFPLILKFPFIKSTIFLKAWNNTSLFPLATI